MEKELLFLFSAIGALNGFLISIYFAFFYNNRNRSTYFLSALLFAISVRITKSVFFAFAPAISDTFLHIGLLACLLIGPLFYLYINEFKSRSNKWWLIHIIPIALLMIVVHLFFPYSEYSYLWKRTSNGYLGWFLFSQWLFYILISAVLSKKEFNNIISKGRKACEADYWVASIIIGTFLVWLAYFTTNYTSYLSGAVSFTFLLYLGIFIITFKKKKGIVFLGKSDRYKNKKIASTVAKDVLAEIDALFRESQVFTKSDFKISHLAELLKISPNYLSQILNDNLGTSFPAFINAYRVKVAAAMIKDSPNFTIEAIGKDCGFKSKTTFYNAFKSKLGVTPAVYKKSNC
ncbi:MAG: helix-turn-helix domain-containing protein [Bacteroidota bacterium]